MYLCTAVFGISLSGLISDLILFYKFLAVSNNAQGGGGRNICEMTFSITSVTMLWLDHKILGF